MCKHAQTRVPRTLTHSLRGGTLANAPCSAVHALRLSSDIVFAYICFASYPLATCLSVSTAIAVLTRHLLVCLVSSLFSFGGPLDGSMLFPERQGGGPYSVGSVPVGTAVAVSHAKGRRQPGPFRSVPYHGACACFWLGLCLLGPLLLSPMLREDGNQAPLGLCLATGLALVFVRFYLFVCFYSFLLIWCVCVFVWQGECPSRMGPYLLGPLLLSPILQ